MILEKPERKMQQYAVDRETVIGYNTYEQIRLWREFFEEHCSNGEKRKINIA